MPTYLRIIHRTGALLQYAFVSAVHTAVQCKNVLFVFFPSVEWRVKKKPLLGKSSRDIAREGDANDCLRIRCGSVDGIT